MSGIWEGWRSRRDANTPSEGAEITWQNQHSSVASVARGGSGGNLLRLLLFWRLDVAEHPEQCQIIGDLHDTTCDQRPYL